MDISQLVSVLNEWTDYLRPLFWWMAAGSILVFLASIIVIPWLIVRLPENFFQSEERAIPYLTYGHPVWRILLVVGKNLVGVVFIIAGFVMLFIPGQGILTMIVGIMLTSFPGKHWLVHWFASRGAIFRSLNALRRRRGVPPFAPAIMHQEYPER
jgi:hypothetical protein